MGALFRFTLLMLIKLVSAVFFRFDVHWVGRDRALKFQGVRVGILLNHTSLYEPIFIRLIPNSMLWRLAVAGIFPGADKTMNRPIVGRFFRMLARKPMSITRKRDYTWTAFKEAIDGDSLIILAPEGRMKRANGLDLNGNPMTVRGGIADVLEPLDHGRMVVLYSGGLHHVQVPGQLIPKPFKRVQAVFENVDIASYKQSLEKATAKMGFRKAVIQDLEHRRNTYCGEPSVDWHTEPLADFQNQDPELS